MQQNVLVISGLSSASNIGLARSIRMITDMGHLPYPVLTAIDTSKDKKHPVAPFIVPTDNVIEQLSVSMNARILNAVQIGYIGDIATQKSVCELLREHKNRRLIPIAANPCLPIDEKDQDALTQAVNSFAQDICPLADIITPSVREAEALTGITINEPTDMVKAAESLLEYGCKTVLLRNGEFQENQTTHLLVNDTSQLTFSAPRLLKKSPDRRSGFGNAFAAAIVVSLAKGQNYEACIERALVQVKRMSLSEL